MYNSKITVWVDIWGHGRSFEFNAVVEPIKNGNVIVPVNNKITTFDHEYTAVIPSFYRCSIDGKVRVVDGSMDDVYGILGNLVSAIYNYNKPAITSLIIHDEEDKNPREKSF